MRIRPEQPADAAAVRAVHTTAFANDAGTTPAEAGLVDELRRSGDAVLPLCLVAEIDGQVVGHVAVSRGTPDGLLGVGPLAVLPEHRRHGVGSALMHSVVAAGEALWYVGLVLLGDPAFYRRFGFVPAGEHGIVPAHDWPRDAFLLRTLPSSWNDDYPQGTVFRYAPAFDAVS